MSYHIGIDLGTTYTAAAVHREGRAQIFSLGGRAAAIPSVVLLREDETVLTGEAAVRRAITEPERVAREFKRRLGDTTPIIVGGTPYSAEALMARLLKSVIAEVEKREGAPPDRIAISHPANWGQFKIDLLAQAVRIAGLDSDKVTYLTEPEAAAISYASQERVEAGEVVAVYDLGGGTFDAAVLRRTDAGFEILGKPEGIERLGGIDFDAAVFAHITRALDGALEQLDPDDPAAQSGVARLRADCVEAKEALSSDTDATVPVLLPNIQTDIRITRREFETLIRPSLVDSIEAMRRALGSAGVEPSEVSRVLLVGGSSRVPLISQLVSSELGRPVAVDAHPKHAVALGAAYAASGSVDAPAGADAASSSAAPAVDVAPSPPVADTPAPEAAAPARPATDPTSTDPTSTDPTSTEPPAAQAPVRPAPTPPPSQPSPGSQAPPVPATAPRPKPPEPERLPDPPQTDRTPPPRLTEPPAATPAPAAATPAAVTAATPTPAPAPVVSTPAAEPVIDAAVGSGPPPDMSDGGGGGNRTVLIAALVGLVAVAGIIGAVVLSGGDGDETDTAAETNTTVSDDADENPATTADDNTEDDNTEDENTDTTEEEAATTTALAPRDDADIRTEVLEEISFAGGPIEVDVVGGVATLTGTVFDETLEADAIAAAEAVEGVTSVVDNIEPLAEEFRCTDEIKAKERWVCLTEATFDGSNINLVFEATPDFAWSTNGGFHFHIFDGRIPPETAGTNNNVSDGTGSWALTDQLTFSTTPGAIGGDADIETVCVRVATDGHGIDSLESGNCWPVSPPE